MQLSKAVKHNTAIGKELSWDSSKERLCTGSELIIFIIYHNVWTCALLGEMLNWNSWSCGDVGVI